MVKEKKAQKTGNCAHCGDIFIAKSKKRKYCSETCRVRFCEARKKQKEAAPPQQEKEKIINGRKHHPKQTFLWEEEKKPTPQVQGMHTNAADMALANVLCNELPKLVEFAKKNTVKTTFFALGGIALIFVLKRRKKG